MAEEVDKISIRVLVEKGKNKVVYAEAGKDFVDVLFSFLTMPLGTTARPLNKKDSSIKAVKFGSIKSLYQRHARKCNSSNQRNRMENSFKNMKLNIDDTEPLQFLNFTEKTGFANDPSTFIVSDDLLVMPNLIEISLNLLQKHGINDVDSIDTQTVNLSKKEVVDLFKLSLVSKTPMSDFIFKKEQFVGSNYLDPRNRLRTWSAKKKGLSILKNSLTSTSVLTNSLIGSRAVQFDLSSHASLKDRPLKKSGLSLPYFISFICHPFKRDR